jgi:hypothetical protein
LIILREQVLGAERFDLVSPTSMWSVGLTNIQLQMISEQWRMLLVKI